MNFKKTIWVSWIFFILFAQPLRAQMPDCSRPPGSRPFPEQPAGRVDRDFPIEHIVVLMQENHSFDIYFGHLNDSRFYGSEIDGLLPTMNNLDSQGLPVFTYHEKSLCVSDPAHDWDSSHLNWNFGKNDGFAQRNSKTVMASYNHEDLPLYYALANQFATSDRYFASVLSSTLPNRFFLLTGTAFGQTESGPPPGMKPYTQKTIFEVLNEHGISWGYYANGIGYLAFFAKFYLKNQGKIKTLAQYQEELGRGTLPQVVFLDAPYGELDEHPTANIQKGQALVSSLVRSLMTSVYWKKSVFFLTYDEGGGFFDHVPPPAACKPDSIPPVLAPGSFPGQYDRYGFRVPFIAISPFAKHHYVSHKTYDHTSILKFIETVFNLPALTSRDANANNMLDLFDFKNPIWNVSSLPTARPDPHRDCHLDSNLQ